MQTWPGIDSSNAAQQAVMHELHVKPSAHIVSQVRCESHVLSQCAFSASLRFAGKAHHGTLMQAWQTDRQTDRHTDRQTDRQTDAGRQTDTYRAGELLCLRQHILIIWVCGAKMVNGHPYPVNIVITL